MFKLLATKGIKPLTFECAIAITVFQVRFGQQKRYQDWFQKQVNKLVIINNHYKIVLI